MTTTDDTTPGTSDQGLTAAQMEILAFERAWWMYAGRRAAIIKERFGHTATRHGQIVQHLIDQPAAMAYDPTLVKRLLDRRDRLRASRRGHHGE